MPTGTASAAKVNARCMQLMPGGQVPRGAVSEWTAIVEINEMRSRLYQESKSKRCSLC
jgi:hypothetical protein